MMLPELHQSLGCKLSFVRLFECCSHIDDVNIVVGEDRIPYKEGFSRPGIVKTQDRLGNMTEAVAAVPV